MLNEVEWENGEEHQGDGVVDPWIDGMPHVDDGLDRQAVDAGVHWQHNVGIEEDVDDADDEGGHDEGDLGTFFRVHAAIDQRSSEDEDHAADEV